jgi:hypothetical protein
MKTQVWKLSVAFPPDGFRVVDVLVDTTSAGKFCAWIPELKASSLMRVQNGKSFDLVEEYADPRTAVFVAAQNSGRIFNEFFKGAHSRAELGEVLKTLVALDGVTRGEEMTETEAKERLAACGHFVRTLLCMALDGSQDEGRGTLEQLAAHGKLLPKTRELLAQLGRQPIKGSPHRFTPSPES